MSRVIEYTEGLISVIVPVYNVEKYIDKCIKSILNQTYQNFEIILVDDGSPDNCGLICDEYAKIDSRIKVIHKENGGLSSARNSGLDIALGEYISFIDSDDYIESSMFEKMIERITSDNSDLCICNINYVDESNDPMHEINCLSPIKNETIDVKAAMTKLCNHKYWFYVPACNKVYRTRLFETLRFNENKINEDNFLVHHIFNKCSSISLTDERLYNYFQRKGSIMNSTYSIKNLDNCEAILDRIHFFIENGYYRESQASFSIFIYLLLTALNNLKTNDALIKIKKLKKKAHKLHTDLLKRSHLRLRFSHSVFFFSIYLYRALLKCDGVINKLKNKS